MFTLDQIIARFGGELAGDGSTLIERVATLENADAGSIGFLANPKYASQLASCKASAVILAPAARERTELPRIVTPDPYVYFARVSQLLNPPLLPAAGVAASAVVESVVPDSVSIAAGAVVGKGVTLGEGVVIGAGCHVGDGVQIGDGTVLYANVSIYHDCVVGQRCILHSGVVIGADGFGFARERDGSWVKIPQIGRVLIGDDVEIGANTTVDRGAMGDTVIGNDVKLDNLVQIAHNVRIGDHTVFAGCAGVAGSTTIGKRCLIGGQAGISGHLEIADDVVISAWTLVGKSVREPGVYTATLPLQQHGDWVRNFAHLRHLDNLADKVRRLEKLLAERSDT